MNNNVVEFSKIDIPDYIDQSDGLKHCGVCHKPKERVVDWGHKVWNMRVWCDCEEAQAKEQERLEELRKNKEKIEARRRKAFPESKMINWTFSTDDSPGTKASIVSKNYVKNFEEMKKRGKGLLYLGSVGIGKSFYAACVVNELIDKDYSCLMTNFPRLVNTISGMYNGKQEYIDSLNEYDLLVIDDLATERDTEFMNEIVYTIINSRYLSGLPTIVTTNLSGDELKNSAAISKQRVFSRVLEMTLPVEMYGTDRRKIKLAEDYNEFKDILGL